MMNFTEVQILLSEDGNYYYCNSRLLINTELLTEIEIKAVTTYVGCKKVEKDGKRRWRKFLISLVLVGIVTYCLMSKFSIPAC